MSRSLHPATRRRKWTSSALGAIEAHPAEYAALGRLEHGLTSFQFQEQDRDADRERASRATSVDLRIPVGEPPASQGAQLSPHSEGGAPLDATRGTSVLGGTPNATPSPTDVDGESLSSESESESTQDLREGDQGGATGDVDEDSCGRSVRSANSARSRTSGMRLGSGAATTTSCATEGDTHLVNKRGKSSRRDGGGGDNNSTDSDDSDGAHDQIDNDEDVRKRGSVEMKDIANPTNAYSRLCQRIQAATDLRERDIFDLKHLAAITDDEFHNLSLHVMLAVSFGDGRYFSIKGKANSGRRQCTRQGKPESNVHPKRALRSKKVECKCAYFFTRAAGLVWARQSSHAARCEAMTPTQVRDHPQLFRAGLTPNVEATLLARLSFVAKSDPQCEIKTLARMTDEYFAQRGLLQPPRSFQDRLIQATLADVDDGVLRENQVAALLARLGSNSKYSYRTLLSEDYKCVDAVAWTNSDWFSSQEKSHVVMIDFKCNATDGFAGLPKLGAVISVNPCHEGQPLCVCLCRSEDTRTAAFLIRMATENPIHGITKNTVLLCDQGMPVINGWIQEVGLDTTISVCAWHGAGNYEDHLGVRLGGRAARDAKKQRLATPRARLADLPSSLWGDVCEHCGGASHDAPPSEEEDDDHESGAAAAKFVVEDELFMCDSCTASWHWRCYLQRKRLPRSTPKPSKAVSFTCAYHLERGELAADARPSPQKEPRFTPTGWFYWCKAGSTERVVLQRLQYMMDVYPEVTDWVNSQLIPTMEHWADIHKVGIFTAGYVADVFAEGFFSLVQSAIKSGGGAAHLFPALLDATLARLQLKRERSTTRARNLADSRAAWTSKNHQAIVGVAQKTLRGAGESLLYDSLDSGLLYDCEVITELVEADRNAVAETASGVTLLSLLGEAPSDGSPTTAADFVMIKVTRMRFHRIHLVVVRKEAGWVACDCISMVRSGCMCKHAAACFLKGHLEWNPVAHVHDMYLQPHVVHLNSRSLSAYSVRVLNVHAHLGVPAVFVLPVARWNSSILAWTPPPVSASCAAGAFHAKAVKKAAKQKAQLKLGAVQDTVASFYTLLDMARCDEAIFAQVRATLSQAVAAAQQQLAVGAGLVDSEGSQGLPVTSSMTTRAKSIREKRMGKNARA